MNMPPPEHLPVRSTPLEADYTLPEVAKALRMSERWIRDRLKEGAEHTRRGHKILFTTEQVEKLRATHAQASDEPLSVGDKRKSA